MVAAVFSLLNDVNEYQPLFMVQDRVEANEARALRLRKLRILLCVTVVEHTLCTSDADTKTHKALPECYSSARSKNGTSNTVKL